MCTNQEKLIDGAWYRFDANGYMITGWYGANVALGTIMEVMGRLAMVLLRQEMSGIILNITAI